VSLKAFAADACEANARTAKIAAERVLILNFMMRVCFEGLVVESTLEVSEVSVLAVRLKKMERCVHLVYSFPPSGLPVRNGRPWMSSTPVPWY